MNDRFDYKKLTTYYENVRLMNNQPSLPESIGYMVTSSRGDEAEIIFLSNNDVRVHVDNFPGKKKSFSSTNLPFHDADDFARIMGRIGVQLTVRIDSSMYQKVKEQVIDDFCEQHNLCPDCITGGWGCTSDHK